MATPPALVPEDIVERLIAKYEADRDVLNYFAGQLRSVLELPSLRRLYHSYLWRLKDPEHLRAKLRRKQDQCREVGTSFDITEDNLDARITDLVGFRLLHLHTSQFKSINSALLDVLDHAQLPVIEGPTARVWDDEYRSYFERVGIKTEKSERMYTSVHYIVQANMRTKRTAEIQVRTLAEELWGEVDHAINYPIPSTILACREQIRVLARVTSGCTRLVDAIFATKNDGASQAPAED